MCGIAGAVGAVDAGVESAVRTMMEAQHHRGPDDGGFYSSGAGSRDGGAVFGFRRLSILDLTPDGHQPMVDPELGNVVVFNGEIYNYKELRAELEAAGVRFKSQGDTEVLLRGYGHWGEGILTRLRGMYGFAIHDPRARRVLLARDRLGIKPVYYGEVQREGGRTLIFASELRALLATNLFERRLDPMGLATYVWNGFVVGPGTMVRGLSLLPAGASMSIALDAPAGGSGSRATAAGPVRRYWSLGERRVLGEREAVEALSQELETAARQHLVSDVPLAVFLSGGVDSSAIAALAVRAGSRRVETFNVGFDEAAFDESAYAQRVASALGTTHGELRLTQDRFRDQLDDALKSLDQPTMDAINTYFVSRLVREAGFTVALAGTGGDELFGGYRSFRDLPRSRRPARLAGRLPDAALAALTTAVTRVQARGKKWTLPPQTRWGKLHDLLATQGDRVGLYQVAYGLFTREFSEQLQAQAAHGLTDHGLPPERARELGRATEGQGELARVGTMELALFIGERLMRDTDAASMAVSLEVRVPLLDHRVVEAAEAVPEQARFQPLGKKALLRKLALSKLDPAIFDRPKSGFVMPIEVWAKDKLAEQIDATFGDRTMVARAGLDQDALLRLWRAFRAGDPGMYWSRIWAPYVLLRWCHEHQVSL